MKYIVLQYISVFFFYFINMIAKNKLHKVDQ